MRMVRGDTGFTKLHLAIVDPSGVTRARVQISRIPDGLRTK